MTVSWDLFDTLIGRRCGKASNLFDIMAERIGDPKFQEKRRAAERFFQDRKVTYSLEDIYKRYGQPELAEIEFELELENVFPIKRYVDQVQPDDIIVSDMYLSEHHLRRLIEKAGFEFPGRIYVSPYGKYSGEIWPIVLESHQIQTHRGDNPYTDMESPRRHNIRPTKVETAPTASEEFYIKHNQAFGWWIRASRLEHIVDERTDIINYLEVEYNVPLLITISMILARKKVKKYLFMARDSQLLQRVFEKLYPKARTEYLYISRDCLRGNSESYFKYFNKKVKDNCLLVDLASSCSSLQAALKNIKIELPQLFAAIFLAEPFRAKVENIDLSYIVTNTQTAINNTYLEMLNYADHWHIVDVDDNGMPITDLENEYNMKVVLDYHRIIDSMLCTMPEINLDPYKVFMHALGEIQKKKKS